MSLQDDYTALRKLLRKVCTNYPQALPNYLATWWAIEQPIVAQEEADKAAKLAARKQELQNKIAALEAELASLP